MRRSQAAVGLIACAPERCDGARLAAAYAAAARWLTRHAARVDSLNVFPVPDGDTGTNMRLTLEAAVRAVDAQPSASAAEVARRAADAALLGARGNSGVILSQILGGFAVGLEGQASFDAATLAAAGEAAVRAAYRAVTRPVEGTMLTVIRDAAEAARTAAFAGQDLTTTFAAAVAAAARSVQRTPDLLPLLREAGVVDAGGEGLSVVLQGILRYVTNESLDEDLDLELAHPNAATVAHSAHALDDHGYCTNFVVRGRGMDLERLRADVLELGASVVVAGSDELIKVHVHTEHPGVALEAGAHWGELTAIEITNMREQVAHVHPTEQGTAARSLSITPPSSRGKAVGVVAVVPSAQMAAIFASHGVTTVSGGQTMNPSVGELLAAIHQADAARVLVLPNNANVVLTAREACRATGGGAEVVSTTTVPQGLAAAVAFLPDQPFADIADAMRAAAATVVTIEVATASRSTTLNGRSVDAGQAIALVNGELVAAGATPEDVAVEATAGALVPDHSLITLYSGHGVAPARAEQLLAHLKALRADLEGELVVAGQPHYPFVVALE